MNVKSDEATKQENESRVPLLDDTEQKKAVDRTSPSAAIVHETIRMEGEEELSRSSSALAWSGLAAGLSIGFSLLAQALLQSHLPDAPWRPLIVTFGYALGYLIVILGRQQLFTENTLTPILPLLTKWDRETLVQVLRLWVVVLLANLVGTFLFAFVLARADIVDSPTREALARLAAEAIHGDFFNMLIRGVFAGWLIALLVWLLPFAESGRIQIIILVTYVVGLGGFAHIVVGSVEVFYNILIGSATPYDYVVGFMLPTLIGNILGGVTLVAVLNHAQVVADS